MESNCELIGKVRIIPFLNIPENETSQTRKLMEIPDKTNLTKLLQSVLTEVPKKTYKKREKKIPEITLAEKARRIFEDMISSNKKMGLDYYTFDVLQDCITFNQRMVLKFILKDTVKKRTGITIIKQEEFFTGKKKGNEIHITPLEIPIKSVQLAINSLKKENIIFTHNFRDKKGILYILNTQKGKEIYDLVIKGKLTKDDCEQLNLVIKREQKTFNTLDLVEDIIPKNGEIISSQKRKYFASKDIYFRHSDKNNSPLLPHETIEIIESQDSLPIDQPKELPKVILLDQITDEKNPFGIFSEEEKLKILMEKSVSLKMPFKSLKTMIKNHGPDNVFYAIEYLEGLQANGKKIKTFGGYLNTTLIDFDLQDYLTKKHRHKNENKNLAVLQCFDSGILKIWDWNKQLNIFIDYLFTAYFTEKNYSYLDPLIEKIHQVISPDEFKNMLSEEVSLENLEKFMSYYNETIKNFK